MLFFPILDCFIDFLLFEVSVTPYVENIKALTFHAMAAKSRRNRSHITIYQLYFLFYKMTQVIIVPALLEVLSPKHGIQTI